MLRKIGHITQLLLTWKTCIGAYSYDIHGNVKSLLQDNPALETVIANGVKQSLKRIDYEYDLVSGKVNAVHYQDGQLDQFHHKYEYDADNRITNVWTSKDNVIWDQDAKYFYYLHGPLARTEIGDQKVQAMDYAYTIQGWIKGVNSNILNPNNDIGRDGEATSINKNIARDAFGYSLNYFGDDASTTGTVESDYKSIGTQTYNFIASVTAAAYLQADASGLFNGNISSMITSLTDIAPDSPTLGQAIPQLTAYRYDQLNRVKQMKAYRDINLANNTWGNGSTYDGSYETQLSYDANGNILKMLRNGVSSSGLTMDSLTYKYQTVANGYANNTNKLRSVRDKVNGSDASYKNAYQSDIDDQAANNYAYDEIGNQIQDISEGIAFQEWNMYGKVKSITRYNGSTMPDLEFHYDGMGHRISKVVKPRDANGQRPMNEWVTTYYAKDAQGKLLAVYEQSTDQQTQLASFKIKERSINGQGRVGADKTEVELIGALPQGDLYTHTLGDKNFDLVNFRGDILTSITDRKIPVEDAQNLGTIAYYKPEIISISETYLFGMPQPLRSVGLTKTRHGYQSQESVDEINGKPKTIYTADNWQYNALTGRRENTDQVVKAWESGYATFGNNPIYYSDPSGALTPEEELNGNNGGGDEKKTVAIDPGHGDKHSTNKQIDPGALGNGFKEKDLSLQVANAINSSLKSFGGNTLMTRTGDIDVSPDGKRIDWRLKQAEGTDVFISVHLNAAGESASGFVVLFQEGATEGKELAESIASEQTVMSFNNATGTKSRPSSGKESLGVLRDFKGQASVLIEVGFITNPNDAKLISTSANEIGYEIAKGIYKYMYGTLPPSVKQAEVTRQSFPAPPQQGGVKQPQ